MVDDQAGRVTSIFSALGHPVRLEIVDRLRGGEARVTELARPFEMSLAGVSKHLTVLERAGLTRRRVDGRDHWISLTPEALADAASWLEDGAAFWSRRLNALEAAVRDGGREELGMERSA